MFLIIYTVLYVILLKLIVYSSLPWCIFSFSQLIFIIFGVLIKNPLNTCLYVSTSTWWAQMINYSLNEQNVQTR